MANGVGYICEKCGSPNVLFDAYAVWDHIAQRMELHSHYDFESCSTCGSEGSVTEVSLEVYEAALEKDWSEVNDG